LGFDVIIRRGLMFNMSLLTANQTPNPPQSVQPQAMMLKPMKPDGPRETVPFQILWSCTRGSVPVSQVSNHSPPARLECQTFMTEEANWHQPALPRPVTISGTFGFSGQSRQQFILHLDHSIARRIQNGRQGSVPKTARSSRKRTFFFGRSSWNHEIKIVPAASSVWYHIQLVHSNIPVVAR
jgi:hypothetical protein